MTHNLFFHLALTFILLHEMDAIRCKEWRIFPGLSLLNDFWGYRIFMLVHILLFYFLFWQLAQPNNESFIKGSDIFFIVHVGLHLLFLMHKKNEFKGVVDNSSPKSLPLRGLWRKQAISKIWEGERNF